MLRGPPDSNFEFSLDVANKSDSDRTFDLAVQRAYLGGMRGPA